MKKPRPPGAEALSGPPASPDSVDEAWTRIQKRLPLVLAVLSVGAGGVALLGGDSAESAAVVMGTTFLLGAFLLLLVSPAGFSVAALARGHRERFPRRLAVMAATSGVFMIGLGLFAWWHERSAPVPIAWIDPFSWGSVVLGLATLGAVLAVRPGGSGSSPRGGVGLVVSGLVLLVLLMAPQPGRERAYQAGVRVHLDDVDFAQRLFRDRHGAEFATEIGLLDLEPRAGVRVEIVRADEGGYSARGSFAAEGVGPCAVYRGGESYRLEPATEPGKVGCVALAAQVWIHTLVTGGMIAAFLVTAATSWSMLGAAGEPAR